MIKNNTWTANVVTLFPEMFPGSLSYSLTGKALKITQWNLKTYDLRKFANGKRKTVDGPSAGGGAGQILKADVLDKAISHIIESSSSYDRNSWPIVALSPRGKVFGASYTDVVAHLPALNLLILISLFGAVLLLVNIKKTRLVITSDCNQLVACSFNYCWRSSSSSNSKIQSST